jgi:hypothetical protein
MRGQWILLCVQLVPFKTNEGNGRSITKFDEVSGEFEAGPA